MQVLSEDILRRIFVHVGPEDTIWNCRRVCKSWDLASKDEDLAQSWIDQNSTWKYDWRNDNNRIQDNESSSSQPLWTYCFHRVTVSKFFQKLINSLSPFWHRVDQPKPVEELYASWNQFHAKDEFNHRLPWELFEFSRITNGIFLSKAQEECIHIKFPLEKPHFVFEKELKAKEADSWAPSMDFNGTGTWKWIRIGLNQAEVEDLVVCCDPENESFGAISMWSSARALGYPVSVSLIELLRGLHWQYVIDSHFSLLETHFDTERTWRRTMEEVH